MIYNYFENEKKLLYFEHGADEIPEEIIAEFSVKDVIHVDFSSNSLISLNCISHFTNLKEVIFDNNFLSDDSQFPKTKLPNIVLLSINNNKFGDLEQLLHNLVRCFPNIRYLSLLGNPLCPALLQDYSEEDCRSYRLAVISRMAKLKFLDAKPVDKSERMPRSQVDEPEEAQTATERSSENMEKFGSIKKFFGFATKTTRQPLEGTSELRNAYNPLPSEGVDSSQSPKSAYGRVKNHYEGSQSQGNRFIMNSDL